MCVYMYICWIAKLKLESACYYAGDRAALLTDPSERKKKDGELTSGADLIDGLSLTLFQSRHQLPLETLKRVCIRTRHLVLEEGGVYQSV